MLDWDDAIRRSWHPVAAGTDLPVRHIFHGRLLDEELAIWRDDAGHVNAWKNQCPHRGARLTLGTNLGAELRCQYHGLRFATGDGRCVVAPAHPRHHAPSIKATRFDACERHGLVWVRLAGDEPFAPVGALENRTASVLRSVVMRVPPQAVLAALGSSHSRVSNAPEHPSFKAVDVSSVGPTALALTTRTGSTAETLVLFVQPAAADKAIVHGLVTPGTPAETRSPVLRRHNEWLCRLRDDLEARALAGAAKAPA